MPVLVMGQIGGFDPQQVFDGAGDVVTLPHFARAGNGAFKRLLRGFGVAVQTDRHIGQKTRADLGRVNHGAVAFDDAGAFKLLHPAQAGRGRQACAFGKVKVGNASICRQDAQYPGVYVIKFRHLLQGLPVCPQDCNLLPLNIGKTCTMTHDILLALISFAFVTSITPGPNNLMLMASGANFGFRRTVPHMLGISLGHGLMVFLVGLGLAGVFEAFPPAKLVFKVASVGYMLWLAWKIAHAGAPGTGKSGSRPLSFVQAAAFQWVNPKAWAMALGAISAYASGWVGSVLVVCAVFACVNLPSVSVWAFAGEQLRHWLTDRRRLAVFNWTMAVLLVASLWPVLRM